MLYPEKAALDGIQSFRIIGRTKLAAVGDTITVNIPSGYRRLKIMIDIQPSGNTDGTLRFNNDSGNNYAHRLSGNGAADSTTASTSGITLKASGNAGYIAGEFDVFGNTPTTEKFVNGDISNGTTGAAAAAGRREIAAKWANTSADITRVDVINADTGDYAAGSEVVVLGLM